MANSEYIGGTKVRIVGIFALTKLNEVRLGGELDYDQRLSGLARERSERTQCPV